MHGRQAEHMNEYSDCSESVYGHLQEPIESRSNTYWPDNLTYQNVIAWSWSKAEGRYLVVVNLSEGFAQARIKVGWEELRGGKYRLSDLLSDVVYDRDANEMLSPGLFVELRPWACHFLQCRSSLNE
jgi:hypothetical protein